MSVIFHPRVKGLLKQSGQRLTTDDFYGKSHIKLVVALSDTGTNEVKIKGNVIFICPDGNKDVYLPPEDAVEGRELTLINTSEEYSVYVKDDSGTKVLSPIDNEQSVKFITDGLEWYQLGGSGPVEDDGYTMFNDDDNSDGDPE